MWPNAVTIKDFNLGQKLDVYTDGACAGNPGPGGWGVFICQGNTKMELGGGSQKTTNNRMELQATIEALKIIPKKTKIDLITDSQYVKNGITQWIHGWKRNNWKTSKGTDVLNQDLWMSLDELCQGWPIQWKWVKGHESNEGNNMADKIAVSNIPSKKNSSKVQDTHISTSTDPLELAVILGRYANPWTKKEGVSDIKVFCQQHEKRMNCLSILMQLIPSLENDLKTLK